MKPILTTFLVLFATFSTAQAEITAKYQNVDSFRDFSLSGNQSSAQSQFLRELKRQSRLHSLVGDRKLELTFTDIDMAGDTKTSRARTGLDLRVVKGVFPPRLSFTYVLRDARGKKIKSGSAKISDLAFGRGIRRGSGNRNFYYELELLEDWARKTIPKS